MNPDRLFRMILRLVMRRGVNAGIDHVARRGKSPDDMTPGQHEQAQSAKQTAKRARQAMRLARRMR